MLTIDRPPVFAMGTAASFVPRNTLVWLTAIIRSHPSSRSGSPTELPEIPALFTKQVGLQCYETAIFVRSTGPSPASWFQTWPCFSPQAGHSDLTAYESDLPRGRTAF